MATITEDYVSFEVAKLLKEKGFDGYADNVYLYLDEDDIRTTELSYPKKCQSLKPHSYPHITHQSAMKWLREVHKIHIQIWILEEKGYWFDIEKILNAQYKHKSLYSTGLEDIYYDTYGEACEAAIKYCLENLI